MLNVSMACLNRFGLALKSYVIGLVLFSIGSSAVKKIWAIEEFYQRFGEKFKIIKCTYNN